MITKDFLEKQIKKHGKVTAYSTDNIPLAITKEPYLCCDGNTSPAFDMNCEDLADYCEARGLSVTPVKNKGGN